MSERVSRLAAENMGLEIRLEDACEILQSVLEALDRELDLGGRVPFDPDVIREFLSR